MVEQTNPQAGVSQGLSDVEKVMGILGQSEDQGKEPRESRAQALSQPQGDKSAEQPKDQATEELTPEDLDPPVDSEAQSGVEAFEIVHQGQQVKLSREETIKYAQQGLDYTRKSQALADNDRALQSQMQILREAGQIQQYLAPVAGQVQAIKAQLDRYQGYDWVKDATEDPMGYPARRAQYDGLREAYGTAYQQYEHQSREVNGRLAQVKQQRLQAEEARLPEFIPEWKDEGKKEAGKAEIVKYLQKIGADPHAVGQKLDDALSLSIAYKAMRYDQLVSAKQDKIKQLRTAPPVTRPGAAQGSDAIRANKETELSQRLRKSGDVKDAAALLLNRMK